MAIISNNSTWKKSHWMNRFSSRPRRSVQRSNRRRPSFTVGRIWTPSCRRLSAIVGLLQWKIIYAFRYQSKQSREYGREVRETKPVRGRVNKKKKERKKKTREARKEKGWERRRGRGRERERKRENDRKGGGGKRRRHEKSGKCSAFTH